MVYIDGLIFSITDNVSQIYVDHNERLYGKSNYNYKINWVVVKMALVFQYYL